MSPANYILREVLLSAVINAAISVAFFLAVFGTSGDVEVWGVGELVFDALPQGFAIGLMATLVPGLMARKKVMEGMLPGAAPIPPSAASIALRALRNGAFAMLVGAGVWAGAAMALGIDRVDYTVAAGAKVAFGALLGTCITLVVLRRLIKA